MLLVYSETVEVWVRASWMSHSCSLILSCIGLPVFPSSHQQRDYTRQRNHGIFRRRVAVYQRSYRRRRTSRATKTRGRPQPCGLPSASPWRQRTTTGFPVNAIKSTSARREDLCKTESKNMSETSDLPVPRTPPFQSTLTTPDTARFGTK